MNLFTKSGPLRRNAFAFVGLIFAAVGWAGSAPPVMWTGLFFFAIGVGEIAIMSFRHGRGS
jgi:hypothetical protein